MKQPLFKISESEKNRILEMHENELKRNYLGEQSQIQLLPKIQKPDTFGLQSGLKPELEASRYYPEIKINQQTNPVLYTKLFNNLTDAQKNEYYRQFNANSKINTGSQSQTTIGDWKNYPCVVNHPKRKQLVNTDGSFAFQIGNFQYYNNGRKYDLINNIMYNYNCSSPEFKTVNQKSNTSTKVNYKPYPTKPSDVELDKYLNL